jgi:hypothetical protein
MRKEAEHMVELGETGAVYVALDGELAHASLA